MTPTGKRLDATRILIYASYLIVIVVFWGPVTWMISLSLKTIPDILAYPPRLFPSRPAIENYGTIFVQSTIPRNMVNSAKITVITVVGTLLVTVPAAYGFSRFRFRGRTQILMAILLFQMISTLIIILPLYRYFIVLDLLDTHHGLIMIYITVQIPFTVWLLKGFFDSIPKSLDDAARIDGASRLQSVIRVIVPVAMPGIAAAVLFNTINAWSQFLIPFILIGKGRLQPISVGVAKYAETVGEAIVTTHLLAAASLMAMLPAIAIFIALQRFIVRILISGAVKG
ncbi:MAG: carbohydrate ABC transporter permease [Spirochaetaceae bacterium]|nr:carbohydrate ABC transporter permease [Spirochaetaceae bacterium]